MLQLADAHFQPCQLISPRPTRWEKIDHSAFRGPGTGGCPVHAFGIYFYFYFFPGGGRQLEKVFCSFWGCVRCSFGFGLQHAGCNPADFVT